MVKFIASDLDGTLLDGEKHLPEEIFGLIGQLHERGILFAAASGRQYANLEKLFAPVRDKVLFLCENGALVMKDALDEIRALPDLYPMLCGANCAYIENSEMPFFQYAMLSYTNCEKVDDLDAVIGKEPVCKIAVYDAIAAAEHCIKVLPQRLPKLRTIISGYDWCDISSTTANKGRAIRFIRDKFGFQKEECVAFSDHMNDYEMLLECGHAHMNDYEMLLECGHAYVPENAYPPLKRMIRNTIPSNDEGGVLTKLKEILKQTEA